MRTFYITLAIIVAWVTWQLNKPITRAPQVARAFTDSEIDYLEKTFDYAMDNLKEGEYQDWSVAAVNGRISVGKHYVSKQKADCRHYVEVARTHDAQKVESGVACKRQGKAGWCRVHGDNPQSCALEKLESPLKKRARFAILQGNQVIDDLLGTSVGVNTDGMVPHTPNLSAPSVNTPQFERPDIDSSDFRPPMPWDKN
ncbi:MAG: hypothetical protein SFX19_01140 [Alphaproteobacteria bacterium]|nr:hypothetical protein [Alphaproteobacteria bacterium]